MSPTPRTRGISCAAATAILSTGTPNAPPDGQPVSLIALNASPEWSEQLG
jgi:hypothetical protein